MLVTGESRFVSATTGLKKDGVTPWYRLKFLDDDADEFFNVYVDNQAMFAELSGLAKKTPVILTMELVPGSKYFQLVKAEILVET